MAETKGAVPEHIYRWIVVGASAVMMAFGVGFISTAVTVFIVPLNIEFGWPTGIRPAW
jgi:hypothetical protein